MTLTQRKVLAGSAAVGLILASVLAGCTTTKPQPKVGASVPGESYQSVPGESYQICPTYNSNGTEKYTAASTKYLTSPYTYDKLASGTRTYTVAQYQELLHGGASLPSLPAYIAGEAPATEAVVIFAPGSTVSQPQYLFPLSPVLYFFEGGAYRNLGFETVSGDDFIGGSAPGYPEPIFDDSGDTGGGASISLQNDTYGSFLGGSSTLAAKAAAGARSVTLTSPLSQYIKYLNFSDGSSYDVASVSASRTTITLTEPVASAQAAGSQVWGNVNAPIAEVSSAAGKGAASLTLASSSVPVVKWGSYVIGIDSYQLHSVSGSQSSYTIGLAPGGLDDAVSAHTPVFYSGNAGGVTVSYLDITHDIHYGGGAVIATGTGWTITHNNIHDGYSDGTNIPKAGGGYVASTAGTGDGNGIVGGDESTIEYNCLSRMGNDAMYGLGANQKFDYNEIYETSYQNDPGCGCSAGTKWWGSLNADLVDNAFIDDGIGGSADIWLDDGNAGTNISGNYFEKAYGNAIADETGFNININGNLFRDGGWGAGDGCGNSNCVGAVNLNSSGGVNMPLSRYNNHVVISGNQFVNDWGGVDIWESGLRNCESSGEGYPVDAAYCSGGFPTTGMAAAGGHYYFSHQTDSAHGGTTTLARPVSASSTTVVLQGGAATGQPAAAAINDQIGFADPVKTTTGSRASVSTSRGSGIISAASVSRFPSSGQLRVGTSAAGGDGGGGFTGAILAYTHTSNSAQVCGGANVTPCFTGVSLVRGSGTLTGPILQVQPYKVVSETCTANDCTLTVSPAITTGEPVGATVTSAGTCPLFATSAANPKGPLAPNGESYFDGCQWRVAHVSITGNDFQFNPAVIATGTTVTGHVGTSCTAAHNNNCGTNFMAYQATGQLPWNDSISQNAMMSNSSVTGCPSWDSGCSKSPLANINALSNSPNAPAHNNELAWNDVWSNNAYIGPWQWNVDGYGTCDNLPSDPTTGHSMPAGACAVNFANWRGYWQQDVNSRSSTSGPA